MGITWAFGGTAIAGARSSGAVWTVEDFELGPLVFEPRVQQLLILHGEREKFDPIPTASRAWTMTLKVDASGVTGSSTTGERQVMDAWEEACEFWNPYAGAAKLQATRTDADGSSIVRHIYVSPLELPDYRDLTSDPQGLGESGAYPNSGTPHAVFRVSGDTRFPWWIRSTLLDQDTAPAAAELAVSGSPDTVTISNPGKRWVGVKLVVKAASVSGTVNGFTVTNDTHGDVLKVTKATAMAAAESVDWYASDPLEVTKTSTWLWGTGDNKLRIEPGTNTLSIARTGAGTGSLTLQLSWPSMHLSI